MSRKNDFHQNDYYYYIISLILRYSLYALKRIHRSPFSETDGINYSHPMETIDKIVDFCLRIDFTSSTTLPIETFHLLNVAASDALTCGMPETKVKVTEWHPDCITLYPWQFFSRQFYFFVYFSMHSVLPLRNLLKSHTTVLVCNLFLLCFVARMLYTL